MTKFNEMRISIASPEDIIGWARQNCPDADNKGLCRCLKNKDERERCDFGEVKKPETINYRTHKPERDGLFCEAIFGPVNDWQCSCGAYKGIRYKGMTCNKCNVKVTNSQVRRYRMGYIDLVSHVAHPWYVKGNFISQLLDIPTKDLERILYFDAYVVINPGNLPLRKKQILKEADFRKYNNKYHGMFEAEMGAEAVFKLLLELDLDKLINDLNERLIDATGAAKDSIIKRLSVAKMFKNSISRPEWMILKVLPVIPADLRPMVQLDGGRFATSDLNDLYRRVINRNNRLHKLISLNAPDIIIKNEKRMLQEAVNSLIENSKTNRRPVSGAGNRPLKSLNDMLRGKQGRFRQNLLGKRVDYSGRSVIIVGPELKLHQCGVPKKMALELFMPFVMHKLVKSDLVHNVKSAKKIIEEGSDEVWEALEEVTKGHPVLLNRAPTLHRLGIQAFEPVLHGGSALQLHPLVCTAFNADFDGDQMAIHVPLLIDAIVEARLLMFASNNILHPANGKPIVCPSQDMCIGLYYLTTIDEYNYSIFEELKVAEKLGKTTIHLKDIVGKTIMPKVFSETVIDEKTGEIIAEKGTKLTASLASKVEEIGLESIKVKKYFAFVKAYDAILAFENRKILLQQPIYYKTKEKYIITTVGRIIFNAIFPKGFEYQNKRFGKGDISKLVLDIYRKYGSVIASETLDNLKQMGFEYATKSGLSFSVSDLLKPPDKEKILEAADKRAQENELDYSRKLINRAEKRQRNINVWISATEEVIDDMIQSFESEDKKVKFNSIYTMAISGARGNMDQIRQLVGMRGLMSNPHGDIIDFPIKSNFREGLSQTEYFISTYGARKGLVDTALRTADSGYLTRRLVDVAQAVVVIEDDCGTMGGVSVSPLRELRTPNNITVDEIIIPIRERVLGRVLSQAIMHPITKEIVYDRNTIINADIAEELEKIEFILPVEELEEGMVISELLVEPEDRRKVIIRPDRKLTAYEIKVIKEKGIEEVKIRPEITVRSPFSCKSFRGVCRKCYGLDLSTSRLVDIGEAVGIVAAQAIGEPGTQLTMRTFHIGGIALAERNVIKTKMAGEVIFDSLEWTSKIDRAKFSINELRDIDSQDDGEFDANTRRIVVKGYIIVRKLEREVEAAGVIIIRGNNEVKKIDVPKGTILKFNNGQKITEDMLLAETFDSKIISEIEGIVHYEGKASRKEEKYAVPTGSVLKVFHNNKIRVGSVLVEYNPNQVITGYSGEVVFKDMDDVDGTVVSENGKIIIFKAGDLEEEEYKVPQGYTLRVRDGDKVLLGDILAERTSEQKAVISSQKGKVEFFDINIKNNKVINNGILFVKPTDLKESSVKAIELPPGVKERVSTTKKEGLNLKVKNGNTVKMNDDLLVVTSEIDGKALYNRRQEKVFVEHIKERMFRVNKTIPYDLDEENKIITFKAGIAGKVHVLNPKVSSSKTTNLKKIIVKSSDMIYVPDSIKLLKKDFKYDDGAMVNKGDSLAKDGTVRVLAEIKGEVLIKDQYKAVFKKENQVVEIFCSGKNNFLYEKFYNHDILRKTDRYVAGPDLNNIIIKPTDELTEDFIKALIESSENYLEEFTKTSNKIVSIFNDEDGEAEYEVHQDYLLENIQDKYEIKRINEPLSEIMPTIEASIDGSINYILRYNSRTGDDNVRAISIYKGEEYSLPSGLPIKVGRRFGARKLEEEIVEVNDPLTFPIQYKSIEEIDDELIISTEDIIIKKYKVEPGMILNRPEGEKIITQGKLDKDRTYWDASGVIQKML